MNDGAQSGSVSRTAAIILIALAAIGLFAVRATAPHNFLDKDQERPASYILDVLCNGNWVCQTDWMDDVTSKPPMLTWIGALIAVVAGGVTPLTLYLPSALAMAGLAWMIWRRGSAGFSADAGLFAALVFLFSPLAMRLFILLRTDAVFAFMVGAAAFTAHHAWTTGRGWTAFWVLAALATLTKGPLGVVLAAGGLLAAAWERQSGTPQPVRGSHTAGLLLFFALVGGWFLLAYFQFGDALIDKIIRRELVAHAVDIGEADPLHRRIFKPTIYFMHRVLPWSLFTVVGIWRTLLRPSAAEGERRFERFLLCWFGAGLILFSFTQHQRGDLLAPILAPAMLLAGREIALLLRRFTLATRYAVAALLVAASLAQAGWYYHVGEARTTPVRQTERIRAFATDLKNRIAPDTALVYVDVPFTLQLYLGTMIRNIPEESAAERLAGPEPVIVFASVERGERIRRALETSGRKIFETERCADGDTVLFIGLSNRAPAR